MKQVLIDTLPLMKEVKDELHHPCGEVLLQPGDSLGEKELNVLFKSGLKTLYIADKGESPREIKRNAAFTQLPVNKIKAGSILGGSIYDENQKLLLSDGTPIPDNFSLSLIRRGFDYVNIRRNDPWLTKKSFEHLKIQLFGSIKKEYPELSQDFHDQRNSIEKIKLKKAQKEDFQADHIDKTLSDGGVERFNPVGAQVFGASRQREKLSPEQKEGVSRIIDSNLDRMREVFEYASQVIEKGKIQSSPIRIIDEIVTDALAGAISHRDLLLLCTVQKQGEDFLVNQSLATMVASTLIGAEMGFDLGQLKSLAYGSLLCDVGMIKIPQAILEKPGRLSDEERMIVKTHPAEGLELLSKMRGLPQDVPYIVYQSHELSDGSGYPKGKTDVVINSLAKVVNVSDQFVAMCSRRPYREPLLPYSVMVQMMKQAGKRQQFPEVVKVLLRTQSLYPIGSFVLLNDSRLARVVASNAEDVKKPVVALLTNHEQKVVKNIEYLDLLKHEDIFIKNVLPGGQFLRTNPLVGF